MIEDAKITKITETENLLMVDLTSKYFGPCHFVFTGRYITCFGNIESFTWFCTWDTKEKIKQGNCYAHNEPYFLSKLEHKDELKDFDIGLFSKQMRELKKTLLENAATKEKIDEIMDKWDENEYLLDKVACERLDGFDEFVKEMGLDIEYAYGVLNETYKLPYHYYIAVEMLQFIEDYFKDKRA